MKYEDLIIFTKLIGVRRVLEAFIPNALPRAVKFQIDQFEVEEALKRMKDFSFWSDVWRKRAKRFEALAEEKEDEGFMVTAKEFYLRASYRYHFAQLYTQDSDPRKFELHGKCVECYKKAGKYLVPRLNIVDIPFEGTEMPAYLRIPSKKRSPCVVMLDGADSIKEEAHYQAEAFLERGMAVLYFDGPGQGETGSKMKMTEDNYELAVSSVLDFLRNYDVDLDRIGIYGISLGGYLAIRAAAHDKRIKAAVSVGGFYQLRFENLTVATKDTIKSLLGLEEMEDVKSFIDEKMTLENVIRRVDCPLLIVHGEREHMFSKEEVLKMANQAPYGELQSYEEGVHALVNIESTVRPIIGDWLQSKLIQ